TAIRAWYNPAMDAPEAGGPEGGDEALVARARAGDLIALEELFNRYRNQVFSLAYRMTGNPSDAEDLCQEIFLQVMRKVGSFEGRSSFSTWLYRVAMNRSRDYLRRKKRSPELLSHEGDPPERHEPHIATSGGLESEAISSEAQRLVQEALMKLPVSLRAPLVLHELEGMQYHEVASLLKLPVGTVKSRIFRARIKLAEILEPHKEQWR
ncbi:MAG: RNA polymerase sigma factor, partial [Candidatus Geothermincolia bacterium]